MQSVADLNLQIAICEFLCPSNKAKEKGMRFGAVRKLNVGQIKELREKRKSGVFIKILMSEFKLPKASVIGISESGRKNLQSVKKAY